MLRKSRPETLIKNRNLLMHSMMVEDTLYKTMLDGERLMLQATTTQIRAVADDLHRYFGHGRYLAKCIVIWIDANHTPRRTNIIIGQAIRQRPSRY
jgi:hypothetical protein